MPLHPKAQALINQLIEAGFPPNESVSAEEARANYIKRRALNPPQIDPVAAVEDRSIPGPNGEIPLRVYTPNTSDTTGGAIVYFHGGGWVLGDLDSHDAVCRALANASGSIVISTDYRLAPEHRFPAAADDAYAATRWVADNATLLRIDPKKVAVAGDSAGGNLAAAVTLMARDQAGPDLAFQVLIYPVTDANFDTPSYIENAVGYLLTRTGMQWYWNHYTAEADRTNPYASPSRATTLGALPPALVITAEYDPLRDEGEAYATALRSAGVPTTLTRYPGLVHGFLGYFGIFDESRAAIAEIGAAVRAALTAERKIPV